MMELSLARARRMALAAQGFADPRPTGSGRPAPRAPGVRPGRPDPDRLGQRARAVAGAAAVRAARSAPARPAAEDARRRRAVRVLGARGVAAADRDAAVVPVDDGREVHPLGRACGGWRRSTPTSSSGSTPWSTERGPIAPSDIAEREGRSGPWWGWDNTQRAFAVLFAYGEISARRRSNFEREYDLLHRMLPAEHVDDAGAHRGRVPPGDGPARGALARRGHRRRPLRLLPAQRAETRPVIAELVDEGQLLPARVEGWKQPAFVPVDARVPRWVRARALLSPFDSLIWFRDRTERLFGFRYRIEIYTPAPKRVYGYYVLPFLLGDRLVARVDLKADRAGVGAAGARRVRGGPGRRRPRSPRSWPPSSRSWPDGSGSTAWRWRRAATSRRRCGRRSRPAERRAPVRRSRRPGRRSPRRRPWRSRRRRGAGRPGARLGRPPRRAPVTPMTASSTSAVDRDRRQPGAARHREREEQRRQRAEQEAGGRHARGLQRAGRCWPGRCRARRGRANRARRSW